MKSCFFIFLFTLSCVVVQKRCPAPKEYRDRAIADIMDDAENTVQNSEKKAVALGLFGSKDQYVDGTIRNVKLVKKLYPSWDAVVYIDPTTVPAATIAELRSLGAVLKESPKYRRAAARFFIADDLKYDRFIVRDVDSRINLREVAAVADWMKTNFVLHNMHDWPSHKNPLMGGMWGARSKELRKALKGETLESLYDKYIVGKEEKFGIDESFLRDEILSRVGSENLLTHESFRCGNPPNSRGFPIVLGPGLDMIGGQWGK